jgi:mannosyl-3-phosphoglycerate phosphatase
MMRNDQKPSRLVIFTDLDGTLLERRTYDHREALPALDRLRAQYIPLVLCSSKTRSEQDELRARLGIKDPFIVEDGGAVYIERGYFKFRFADGRSRGPYLVIEFGTPYTEVRRIVSVVAVETGISLRGYGDMDAAAVAALTGLDIDSARRAMEREYEETLVIEPDSEALARLEEAFASHGLTMTRGSSFLGVKGTHDKGTAVRRLIELYRRQYGDVVSAGIGDSRNDGPLLAAVDLPYLVQKEEGGWEDISIPRLRRITGVGPVGWRTAVHELVGKSDIPDA